MKKDDSAEDSEGRCRKALEPFGQHFQAMFAAMVALSDAELATLSEACSWPTQTNCGWHLYDAAKYLRGEVRRELSHRKLSGSEKNA